MTAAVARTLGDPTLELWFWVADRSAYVDGAGRPVATPAPVPERGVVEVELAGERVGAIHYDTTLIAEPDTVRTAGRVVALALERERLIVQLLDAREALRHNLTRVVEGADRERRRIARDLHDGLQSRLVLLGIDAHQIEHDPTASGVVHLAAGRLRADIDAAADELRRLVHGLLPATLVERGLFAATKDLCGQLPMSTKLTVTGSDNGLPSAVESAAYFVVAEAITNAMRHSHARELTVRLDHLGSTLHVAVCDDGVGGAVSNGSGGLTGLADRVQALGGGLTVASPYGHGTRLLAELPCGS